MSQPLERYDQRLMELVDEVASHDVKSKEFLDASKNLRAFLEARQLIPKSEPEPEPVCEPQTLWGKAKAWSNKMWESETTRVFIKAGGSLGGVALVVFTTVHRDHVADKTALAQANQRPS